MGERARPVESVAVTTFWRDRPTLVTGATGFLGGWLTRELTARGADVVCLVRDWVGRSELLRATSSQQPTLVRGDVRSQSLMERVLGEYEIDTVFHLAAQAVVGIASRNPPSTLDTNIRGTWTVLEACRRSPLVRQVVIASSDKAYGAHDQLPYREDMPLQGRYPYDVSKSCADLIAQSYARHVCPAGDHQPLRQPLRWRRPQLEPPRPRHHPFGASRRASCRQKRRAPAARLPVC